MHHLVENDGVMEQEQTLVMIVIRQLGVHMDTWTKAWQLLSHSRAPAIGSLSPSFLLSSNS